MADEVTVLTQKVGKIKEQISDNKKEIENLFLKLDDMADDVEALKRDKDTCFMESRISNIEEVYIRTMNENKEQLQALMELVRTFAADIRNLKNQFKFYSKIRIDSLFRLLQYVTGVTFLYYVLSNLKSHPELDGSNLFTWVGIAALMFIFPDNPLTPIIRKFFGNGNGNHNSTGN